MTYFHIGNISIPAVWLSSLLALIVSALLARLAGGKKTGEWHWNAFFLYTAVWKLSYIPFNLEMFVNMPLSLVYFNGGLRGHFLGLTALSLYLMVFAIKKYGPIHQEMVHHLFLFYVSFESILNFIENKIPEASLHALLWAAFLLVQKRNKQLTRYMYILMILLELLMLSIFNDFGSPEIITFVWVGIVAGILSVIPNKSYGGIKN